MCYYLNVHFQGQSVKATLAALSVPAAHRVLLCTYCSIGPATCRQFPTAITPAPSALQARCTFLRSDRHFLLQDLQKFFSLVMHFGAAGISWESRNNLPVKVKFSHRFNPYPTAFPYGNGMVLHFYQQQESNATKTVHRVINKGLKAYV